MKKLVPSLLTLTFALHLQAGTHVWSGAQDGLWGNAANWSSGGAPTAFEAAPVILQFPTTASARRQTTNNIANLTLDVLAFYGGNYTLSSSGPAITINGNPPPFPYGGNLMSGAGTNNLMDATTTLVFSNNVQILVGSGATLEVLGWFTGPGALTKIGPGELWYHLSAECDYQGPTTVLDGTLFTDARTYGWFDFIGTPGLTIPNDLSIGDTNMTHTPKVQLWDANFARGSVTIQPNGTFEIASSASLSSPNMTMNSLTMTGGTLRFLTNGYQLNCVSNIVSYPTPLATATITGGGSIAFVPSTNYPHTFINVVGGLLSVDADFAQFTTIHKTGAGELGWSGSAQYLRYDFIVEQGLLALTGSAPFYNNHAQSLTVSNGAQVSVRGASYCDATLHLNGFGLDGTNGALVIEHDGAKFSSALQFDSDTAIMVTNATDTFTVVGDYAGGVVKHLQGPANLFKRGPGTLQITGNQTNAMTGSFHVEQGVLALNNTQQIAAVNSPLFIGPAAAGTTAEVKFLIDNQLPLSVPVTVATNGTVNVFGTYQNVGPLTLQGGDIKTSTGTLVLNTDVLATNGVGSTISGNLLLGAVKRTFHLAPGYGLSIAAQISDNGPTVGFDLEGGGMLTLTGSNTFSGPLNVKAGVLYARNDNALGKITGGTTIWSGARLAIDGRNLGGEPFTLNGDGGDGYGALSCAKTNNCNGLVTLVSDATINVVSATDRLTFGSIVNGPQGITKIGAGALAFTGNQANTYSGATTVSEGALELNKHGQIAVPGALTIGDNLGLPLSQWVRALGTNQFAAGAPVTVNWSGVLDLSGATAGAQTVGSLVGIGPARLGANALTVGGNNADAQYNGSITGSANAALRKQGSGKWTLGGASDQFFGVTVVNGGKLFVQNWNPASPVTVNAGALLAGNGRVGTVTTAGGAFTPGGGLNQMKMESKDVGLDPSATFSVQLSGPIPGISYSQLSVTGLVNLANATLNPTLNFASSISNQFVLIVNDGSDPVTGTFKNLPQGGTLVLGGALFQISYQGGDGNDVVLTQISAITPLQIGGIAKQVGGVIQLHGAGLPGANYAIEANADLNTTNWINIGGVAADANGLISFIDLNAPNFPMRFYRFKTQ